MLQDYLVVEGDTFLYHHYDSLTQSEIYTKDTIEDTNIAGFDFLSIWTPIIIAFIALGYSIWSGNKQLKRQRVYKEEDEKNRLEEKKQDALRRKEEKELDDQRRYDEKELDYKERRLNVKPILNYELITNGNKCVFNIHNYGVGTATITKCHFLYKKKKYNNIYDVIHLISNNRENLITDKSDFSFSPNGFDIGKDGKKNVCNLFFKNSDNYEDYIKEFNKIQYVIFYQNIYEESLGEEAYTLKARNKFYTEDSSSSSSST